MTQIPSPDHDSISSKVLGDLRHRMRDEQFSLWFRDFQLKQFDDQEIVFTAASVFARDWITRNFMPEVKRAVEQALGDQRRIRISVSPGADSPAAENGPATAEQGEAADRPGLIGGQQQSDGIGDHVRRFVDNVSHGVDGPADPPAGHPAGHRESGRGNDEPADQLVKPTSVLNKHYTFEQFVIGPCNRLAHAAAMAIGENPGKAYNPFFVHGDVGLGKTHLLQGICHALTQMHPKSKVIYLSCEEFTNRFIEANQNQAHDAFRNYYRSADILVIDDIEFLAQKGRTQVEFFHTFNALYNAQKQIVLSSDRRANEIPTLEDRLVSRFRWGMEAQISPPCLDTRAKILKRKAFLRSVILADDVANLIAESITTNIRELEGALIKVLGLATISNRPVDVCVAREALDQDAPRRPVKVSHDDIMKLITNEFSVSAKEIFGKGRTQAISHPRQIGMYLARKFTDHSLEEVGRYFGNRDHTTVLYAVGKIKKRCERDRAFHASVEDLGRRLQAPPRG